MNVRIAKKVRDRSRRCGDWHQPATRYRRPTLLAALHAAWRSAWRSLRAGDWQGASDPPSPEEHLAYRKAALDVEGRLLGRWLEADFGGGEFLVQSIGTAPIGIYGLEMNGIGKDGSGCRWSMMPGGPHFWRNRSLRHLRYAEPGYVDAAPKERECRVVATAGEPDYEAERRGWYRWRLVIDAMAPGTLRDEEEYRWQGTAPMAARTVLVEERASS